MNDIKQQINELLSQAEKDYKNTALTPLTNHIHYGEIRAFKKIINLLEKNNNED